MTRTPRDGTKPGERGSGGTARGAWRPLLQGAMARQALDVVGEIRDALHELPPPTSASASDKALRQSESTDASLAGGLAGRALFHAYFGEALGSERDLDRARECLKAAAGLVSSRQMTASLFSGFTGVAWAMEHLRSRLFDEDGDDPNEAIDEALVDHLGRAPWRDTFDLIYGLAGIGVYGLERWPRRGARLIVERVVDRLEETASPRPEGVAWFTPADQIPIRQRERSPEGHFNTGMAHGVPGVIALLGRTCGKGVAAGKGLPLLQGAVRWLLAQRLDEESPWAFPMWIGSGIASGPSRIAWCYGDPGIAVSLLGAGRSLGERDWEREAVALAQRAALLPDRHGVQDAGLCHGAAGLGHLYNRMAQATGDPALRDAARSWLGMALEMRTPGKGIAGYAAWLVQEDGTMGWTDDPELLTGAAGVALAFLAAATPHEPAWDRILLADIPPAQ
jgi:class I lanthipeptide synthase